ARGKKRLSKNGLVHGPQPHIRAASRAPCTRRRLEPIRLSLNELFLLLRRQLDHTPARSRMAECCEDFAANAEVWMAHVRGLGGLRQAQSKTSEPGCGHRCVSLPIPHGPGERIETCFGPRHCG